MMSAVLVNESTNNNNNNSNEGQQQQPVAKSLILRENAPLFFYAIAAEWDEVMHLLELDPDAAYIASPDYNNESALSWACENDAPLDVLEALVAAAPEVATIVSEYDGCTAIKRLFNGVYGDRTPDKSKVLTLLKATPIGSQTSCLALLRERLDYWISESLENYKTKDDIPQGGPFDFLDDDHKSDIELTWDLFCTIFKILFYKKMDGLEDLPLLPAILCLDISVYNNNDNNDNSDEDETYGEDDICITKTFVEFVLRFSPNEVALKVPVKIDDDDDDNKNNIIQQFAVHQALENYSKTPVDIDGLMTCFKKQMSLLSTKDTKSSLLPFCLAGISMSDFQKKEQKIQDQVKNGTAILDQKMIEYRQEALVEYGKEEDEGFKSFLRQYVMELLDDSVLDDLYADDFDIRFGDEPESVYEKHLQNKRIVKESVDLSFRLLRALPHCLQLAVNDGGSSSNNNKTRKLANDEQRPEDAKKTRTI